MTTYVQIQFRLNEIESEKYLKEWKKQNIIIDYGFVHPNMSGGHCMD